MAKCQKCGRRTTRSRLCRDCGQDERRDPGPVGGTASDDAWAVEQQGLDGEPHEGQATLDGGVAKDGGETE